jgi:hypothetical protein
MSRDLAERVVYTLDEDAGVVTPDGKRDALLSGTEVVLAESTPAAPDEEGLDAAWLEREWTAWKHGHVDLTSEQFAATVLFRNHLARALASQDKA